MDKPTAAPAGGAKEKIEKQARQLAYDTRYKVKQAMSAKAGGKSDPVTVKKAYAAQLAKSSAAPAVKARAKQMLLGEDLVDTKRLATESVVSALYNVFVTGEVEQKVVEEVEDAYLLQLEESEDTKYKVRVTDKKTGNSYVRMATRAKISELRANPNISSVEMTGYGEPTKSEKAKGSSTAKAKAGKGLDPVGQEDKDVDNDGDHDKSDKYLMKRRKAVGKAIATRKEDYNWQNGFAELIEKKKEEKSEKKLTGEGVNNSNLIKVFPDSDRGIKEGKEEEKKEDKKADAEKKDAAQDKQTVALQKKTLMAKLQQLQKGIPLSQEEVETDGEELIEKAPPGAKYERMVKHIKAGYADGGLTKKERSIAYATAWKAKNKAVKEEACGCEDKKEPKLKKSEGGVEDPREIPTKLNLAKNKLRAMGLKMSYEPEGEQLQEKPGDGYLGPTPIPNPIRLTKDVVDATNRASQKKVDAVNAVLPGSASMPKNVTYFNKGPSAASQKYLGLKNSYEPEGEVIDERRKEDKVAGTPRKPRNPAFELVAKSMGTGRMGVKPRGQKKVPGKKPPAAGEYGAPTSPAQKVEKIRAARKRAQDNMSSRFD